MTDIKLTPSSVTAFTEALKGESGSLDAWLEVNDESEVAAHIEAYASACVAHATAQLQAEIAHERWLREQAENRCVAVEDQREALRAEVERANSWNARVSVCRDHVADIVDGLCVICVLDEVEAYADRMWAEADRLAKDVIRVQQQYDERTACVIVHRGSALACSDAVRDAYLDERRRADRLAELLDQAYGHVPSGTLADQIHCALTRYWEEDHEQ